MHEDESNEMKGLSFASDWSHCIFPRASNNGTCSCSGLSGNNFCSYSNRHPLSKVKSTAEYCSSVRSSLEHRSGVKLGMVQLFSRHSLAGDCCADIAQVAQLYSHECKFFCLLSAQHSTHTVTIIITVCDTLLSYCQCSRFHQGRGVEGCAIIIESSGPEV
jgi:hypothetical protein